MQLLLAPFQGPLQFAIFTIASVIGGGFVFIFARAAMASEGRSPGLVKAITNPNAKFLFAFLAVGWAIVFGGLAILVLGWGDGLAALIGENNGGKGARPSGPSWSPRTTNLTQCC